MSRSRVSKLRLYIVIYWQGAGSSFRGEACLRARQKGDGLEVLSPRCVADGVTAVIAIQMPKSPLLNALREVLRESNPKPLDAMPDLETLNLS